MRMRNGRLTKRSNDTKDEMTVDIFEADIIECYRSGYDFRLDRMLDSGSGSQKSGQVVK